MITLTEEDAAWLRDRLTLAMPDDEERRADRLLTLGSPEPADPDTVTDRCTCNQADTDRDHGHQRGDLGVCRDAIDAGVVAGYQYVMDCLKGI